MRRFFFWILVRLLIWINAAQFTAGMIIASSGATDPMWKLGLARINK